MNITKIMAAIAIILLSGVAAASATPSIANIPNQVFEKNSDGMDRLLDLRNYTRDETYSASRMFYSIEDQTDPRLADCYIEDDYFISCSAPREDSIGANTITVKATNPQGLSATATFEVYVNEPFKASEIVFTADRDTVTLENNDSINVQLTAENNTSKKQCFETVAGISTEDRHEIEAEIYPESFCLSAGQGTTFTLTITADNETRTGTYDIAAKIISENGTAKTKNILAKVTDSDEPINIERVSAYYLCKEPYTQEIKIRLENNSTRTQNIELSAEHELLLPTFEFANTTLRAGQDDEMAMMVNTNMTTEFGEYTIPIFIRSENYYVERDVTVRLVECEKNTFELAVTPSLATISKGKATQFKVTVKNLLNKAQDIRLSSDSDLPNELEKNEISVPANSIVLVKLTVETRETDKTGKHNIKVYAWNSEKSESQTVQVDIKKEHKIEMIVENNNFQARQCSANNSQTFAITLRNKGDFDETAKLKLTNVDESIQAVLSDKELSVKKGEEKKFYVFISPSFSAELGDYTVRLTAKAGNEEISEDLKFRVVEAENDVQKNVIQVLTYPQQITIAEGESKTLTFTIKNPTGADMHNIAIRIYGISNGAAASPVAFQTLKAGETKTVNMPITALNGAGNKTFNATLEVKADGYVTTKNIALNISKNGEENSENGLLGGFAVLLGDRGIQTGAMVLIALILVSIIAIAVAKDDKAEEISNYTGT